MSLQRTPLLQEVSIAQNRLDSIYLDAFEGLPYLKRLNLSYNRLESFNEFILERNTNMEELDLSGNNFLYLEPGPLLGSGSLKVCFVVYSSPFGGILNCPSISSNYIFASAKSTV